MNLGATTPVYPPTENKVDLSLLNMISFKDLIQKRVPIADIRVQYSAEQLQQFQQLLLTTPIQMDEPFDVINVLKRISLLPVPSSIALSYPDIASIVVQEPSAKYPSLPLVQNASINIPIDINPNQSNYMISIGGTKFCREGLDRTISAFQKSQVYIGNENALRYSVQQQFWKNPTYVQKGIDFLNVIEKLQQELPQNALNNMGEIARECAEAKNQAFPKCKTRSTLAPVPLLVYDFQDNKMCYLEEE